MSDDVIIPEIHVLLAEIYKQEGFLDKQNNQLDKLLNSEITNLSLLTYLKQMFETSKDAARLSIVMDLIDAQTSTKDIIEDVSTLSKDSDPVFMEELESNE